MGPKSVAASLPSKNLSWLDRMYMKVENICAEVDKNPSILIQDTSKFVESQMKVVGVNVKKLCSEIIQDFLPPPILSSEKKAECAVHCKCNCMEFEKPKQKHVDITKEVANTEASSEDVHPKGFEDGKKMIDESALEKQNFSMRGDAKVDVRNVDFASEKMENCQFQGNNQKLSGEEPDQFTGCDEMRHGIKEGTKHVFERVEAIFNVKESAAALAKHTTRMGEEELQRIGEEWRNSSPEMEAPTQREEQEMTRVQEEVVLVTSRQSVWEEPAIVAGSVLCMEGDREELGEHDPLNIGGEREELVRHISFTMEGGREELVIHGGHFAVDMMKNVGVRDAMTDEGRGLDFKDLEQAVEASCEMHAEKASDVRIPSFGMLNAEYARLRGSMEAMEVVEAEDSRKEGVDFGFMYSYAVIENSRSSQDSMILSDYLHEEEEDSDQTARWLVGEDIQNIIRPENFAADIAPQRRESSPSPKELDFDWELV